MKKYLLLSSVSLLAFCSAIASAEAQHSNKSVGRILSPDDRPCLFFKLTGVTLSDPAISTSSWFAVPKDHGGYYEIMAMVMTARVKSIPVTVNTTNDLACGVPGVKWVWWQ